MCTRNTAITAPRPASSDLPVLMVRGAGGLDRGDVGRVVAAHDEPGGDGHTADGGDAQRGEAGFGGVAFGRVAEDEDLDVVEQADRVLDEQLVAALALVGHRVEDVARVGGPLADASVPVVG